MILNQVISQYHHLEVHGNIFLDCKRLYKNISCNVRNVSWLGSNAFKEDFSSFYALTFLKEAFISELWSNETASGNLQIRRLLTVTEIYEWARLSNVVLSEH